MAPYVNGSIRKNNRVMMVRLPNTWYSNEYHWNAVFLYDAEMLIASKAIVFHVVAFGGALNVSESASMKIIVH